MEEFRNKETLDEICNNVLEEFGQHIEEITITQDNIKFSIK